MISNAAWVWLVVSVSAVSMGAALPFLWWAIKSGQFKEQDRARYLALTCTSSNTQGHDGDV